jgi:hypothetical protein
VSLRVVTETSRRCEECGEPLPRIAAKVFKANEGCCPRCAFLHQKVGVELHEIEVRDMSVRGQSMIRVPRVQFHRPGTQPAGAIPV